MVLERFHPAVQAWFSSQFEAPTPPQEAAWPSIQARNHTLIAAPTGSGKTLSAFLAAIDDLVRLGERGELTDETRVVYISPLKALSNDVHKNLQTPLEGIGAELAIRGNPDVRIRTLVRTGDTSQAERAAMAKRPPHILVTTPESFYILLTSESGRRMLRTVKTAIVDEIHAVVGSKRGSHLALSLERLEALTGGGLVRVGLSATQKPIEDVARFLVGAGPNGVPPPCNIIDTGHARRIDLAVVVPDSPLEAVMSGEVWTEIYDRLAALIREHRTTLVFVNTRRLSERVARHLSERLGEEHVTSHHGSLSREQRLRAEERLKKGDLKALVATASLELGIDIGDVDLVCQMGSTHAIATLLQRVGRSGHAVHGLPKGRIFPLSRDDLVECAALLDAVRLKDLDRVDVPEGPLDILAQQIIASVACEEWREEDLYACFRRAYPYRDLSRKAFDDVVRMVADGFATRRGRRSAYLHRDAVNKKLRPRRGARLAAMTSGGAIPETADYRVILEPSGAMVGTVNEDFAIESMAGDIFQLGNASWQILRVEAGAVRVADAHGQPPTIPFWVGEAPGRTPELSQAVSRIRTWVAELLERESLEATASRVAENLGFDPEAARQLVEYLAAGKAALGVMPSQETIVLERFFDEAGGMQLVIHAPFGSRLNRAWGLALRKRFCRQFNFELQAAATEDAIVLSLGPTHSFPLENVFHYLSPESVRDVLVQALLDAPMFEARWRWNTTRSLAMLRFMGGKKVPPPLQRMQAADLLTVIFPDQQACIENIVGDREIPDHPLVNQTIHDCLHEAMDLERLEKLVADIQEGRLTLVARDLREPSPLAQEILNARPYAFLDDAPLEERRTQAVISRRWLDPETASDLGRLDPEAIARVREETWPDPRNADELHDALVVHGFLTFEEAAAWSDLQAALASEGRATIMAVPPGARLLVAAERLLELQAIHPDASLDPAILAPEPRTVSREDALKEIVRSRLDALGPVRAEEIALSFGLPVFDIEQALIALENEGYVLRGTFTPGASGTEWCERRLLARVHRYTLHRLRQEIEPVTAQVFLRFLMRWQGVAPGHRGEGPQSLAKALDVLEGFEAAATSWEGDLLPARVADYEPSRLDALCLSGKFLWARLSAPANGTGPVKSTPIALVPRKRFGMWAAVSGRGPRPESSLGSHAANVLALLRGQGASFFHDLAEASGLLGSQVEDALGELVAAGFVTADGFNGLRSLLVPEHRKRGYRRSMRSSFDVEEAGRWGLVPFPDGETSPEDVEEIARVLLRRYGVVFRKVLEREGPLPPWRNLLRVYHRLEARGEIRGGRFVAGFSGEQFALPEAVGTLREARKEREEGTLVSISASDPLNLVGILTPGSRIPSLSGNRVLYRDGIPVAVQVAGEARFLEPLDGEESWKAKKALARRATPRELRAYLGV